MLLLKTIAQAFIACLLVCCNSLLYGVPENLLRKVQSVQNAAACLLTNTRRRDHITPVLYHFQWLPFQRRVEFKIACLVHLQSLASTAPTYLFADTRLRAFSPCPLIFHGPVLLSAIEVSLSQDRACETQFAGYIPCDRWLATNNLGGIWKHMYIGPRNNGAVWLWFFCAVQVHLLSYFLTHLLWLQHRWLWATLSGWVSCTFSMLLAVCP